MGAYWNDASISDHYGMPFRNAFSCFQILQMLLIWGGGGKISLSGEEAFPFFRESFNLLKRENCDLTNLYKTKRREPPDS